MPSVRRMSLLDDLEHIAELEELADLISDDEDEDDDPDAGRMTANLLPPDRMDSVPTEGAGEQLGYVTEGDEDEEDEEEDEDDEEDEDGDEDDEDEMMRFEDLDYGEVGDMGCEDESQFTGNSSSVYGSGEYLDSSQPLADKLAADASAPGGAQRRASKRSFSSAPEPATATAEERTVLHPAERRSTITGPPSGFSRRFTSQRRTNIKAPAGNNNSLTMLNLNDDFEQHGGSMLEKIKSRTFGARLSVVRGSASRINSSRSSVTSSAGSFDAMQAAAAKIESGQFDAFAAASVVAQSAAASAKRGHVQFGTDDVVLCMLTLLNVTNPGDDPDTFTVQPVNIFGYPAGEGKTEAERQGPYVFVMATVSQVHFDEDERYYTVIRADNGSEQRADPGWMNPLKNQLGIEAARRAAEITALSVKEMAEQMPEKEGFGSAALQVPLFILALPLRCAMKVFPWYRRFRVYAKVQVTHLLYGDSKYACRFRCTGINVLVFCSFTFLFIENVKLAFFPVSWDEAVQVIAAIVWCVLALELLFEFLIRPPDYSELIESDQAYAPSTARNINKYHLVFESMALLLFLPELDCVISGGTCGKVIPFSAQWAALVAVDGSDSGMAALGRLCLGLASLRLFGLVRHWKQMWINNTFDDYDQNSNAVRMLLLLEYEGKGKDPTKDETSSNLGGGGSPSIETNTEEDQRLKDAATIGTALMVVNSHRALVVLVFIATVLPMIISYDSQNLMNIELVNLLQENNLGSPSEEDCDYLWHFVESWLTAAESSQTDSRMLPTNAYLLWAEMHPIRCKFQAEYGRITVCPGNSTYCIWGGYDTTRYDGHMNDLPGYFADRLGIRVGGIREVSESLNGFSVRVLFNDNFTVSFTNMGVSILLACSLVLIIFGLTVMRGDAGRLVLDPLRRMLKIVVRYAENPLMETGDLRGTGKPGDKDDEKGDKGGSEELGNYETEQLINAIAKIADLLRKCWGVAGAGIISTNLARTKEGKTVVFNPTVPGKRVYALFGFVAINGFDKQLHALGRDIMILVNDVAKVVHDEVYRWALGDSGQCNRNLGPAFLMVFRIGDFREIHNKKEIAQDVVFNKGSNKKSANALRKRKAARSKYRHGRRTSGSRNIDVGTDGTLQLASLPGIQSFTDRALLGMLKSFAGIHRDKRLLNWKKDWRLGAGVGAFTVSVIYGMDAGWAVEGAVGSEYKIDATYLSPHVNMASRMMSATKQYGVTMLLSQAVEELLSRPARAKLRHLDTVTVKGSSVPQRIFTYDARYEGVDFFLFERSPEKADRDADAYTDKLWEVDQDLRAMRQHVNEEFMETFKRGVHQYLDGKWDAAIETLLHADDIMIQYVVEEGYVDFDPEELGEDIFDRSIREDEEITRIRTEYGDGACKCLVSYMERRKGVPPKDWVGVRKLESK